jgi:ZIP family zinc transporter
VPDAVAGSIMYLMFQKISPKVLLKNSWLTPIGALAGFFVGVFGTAVGP